MVGVNALVTSGSSDYHRQFSDAQNTMLYYPSYRANLLFENNCFFLGSTAYEQYPVTCFEGSGSFIAFEGMVYNIDDATLHTDLLAIATEIHKGAPGKEAIARFLAHADGEFVVLIFDKETHDLCVFNDALGRLPFFWYRNHEVLAFSREIKFMYSFLGRIPLDRSALMEYLLFGYTLGERTLIEGVERLLPATLLLYRGRDHTISKEQVLPLTFEPQGTDHKTPEETIEDLRRSFLEGLRNRVGKLGSRRSLISLSGGLDSRATLAGLAAYNVKPRAIHYDVSPENREEEEYARKNADLFGIPLIHLTLTREPEYEDFIRIALMNDGAQSIQHANLYNFLEQDLVREGNDIIYYTGLYGGELLRRPVVTSGLSTDDDLVHFILSIDHSDGPSRFAPENVVAMVAVPNDNLLQHLRAHLATYPEKDPYTKYIHFKFEEDYKWAGPGEDRNRRFFWTVTPFYSRDFFSTVKAIDEQKKTTLFSRNFLYALDPRTCIVDYYNSRQPLTSPLRLRIYGLAENAAQNHWVRRLGRHARRFRKRLGAPHRPDPKTEKLRTLALDLLERSEQIRHYFSLPATRDVIRAEEEPAKLQLLLTLFIYIDLIARQPGSSGSLFPDPAVAGVGAHSGVARRDHHLPGR